MHATNRLARPAGMLRWLVSSGVLRHDHGDRACGREKRTNKNSVLHTISLRGRTARLFA